MHKKSGPFLTFVIPSLSLRTVGPGLNLWAEFDQFLVPGMPPIADVAQGPARRLGKSHHLISRIDEGGMSVRVLEIRLRPVSLEERCEKPKRYSGILFQPRQTKVDIGFVQMREQRLCQGEIGSHGQFFKAEPVELEAVRNDEARALPPKYAHAELQSHTIYQELHMFFETEITIAIEVRNEPNSTTQSSAPDVQKLVRGLQTFADQQVELELAYIRP